MPNRTPLYDEHIADGGKMVDFAGWQMPINYGSQIEEHNNVRHDAGMFDVSHMTVVDLTGARTREFLRHLLANNVDRLQVSGKALYSCMLNENGGVIDDLIVYFIRDDYFRMVVNAGTSAKDLAWLEQQSVDFSVTVTERPELAMIAIQGPNARARTLPLLSDTTRAAAGELQPFFGLFDGDWFIARTGYTGEDGFEIYAPVGIAPRIWDALLVEGVGRGLVPAGLAARDTLRLEAGMALYGQDIDETTTPLEADLGWIVKLEQGEFIGRDCLLRQSREGVARKLIGFEMRGRAIARHGYAVFSDGREIGRVTSGSYAPFLEKNIGLAYLPVDMSEPGSEFEVQIRNRREIAVVVSTPFYKRSR